MSIHLPYKIDLKNRNHYYEDLWKVISLEQLCRHQGDVEGMSLLDFGCGRGEMMQKAKARGMVVFWNGYGPTMCERWPQSLARQLHFGY